jgi:hypothetical protein
MHTCAPPTHTHTHTHTMFQKLVLPENSEMQRCFGERIPYTLQISKVGQYMSGVHIYTIFLYIFIWNSLHFIYHLWKWTYWQFPQGRVRHRGRMSWMVHSLDLHLVNVLFGDIARVSCMLQRWNFVISAWCNTCHVGDMRDIGTDAGIPLCHTESCATADGDHFKYFVCEEVYFNPVNTRLIQNISMCFTSSVSQMGQTLQWHIFAKKRFLAILLKT